MKPWIVCVARIAETSMSVKRMHMDLDGRPNTSNRDLPWYTWTRWETETYVCIYIYIQVSRPHTDLDRKVESIMFNHCSHQVIVVNERVSNNNHQIGKLATFIKSHDSCQSPAKARDLSHDFWGTPRTSELAYERNRQK